MTSFDIDADGTQPAKSFAVCSDTYIPTGWVSLSASEIADGSWTVLSGTAVVTNTIAGQSNSRPTIVGITSSGSRIMWSVRSKGGCENSDYFDIQNGNPTLTVTSNTATTNVAGVICDGKALLNGTGADPSTGKRGHWTFPEPPRSTINSPGGTVTGRISKPAFFK